MTKLDDYKIEKPNKDEFHSYLFSLIDAQGLKDPDVYKKAGIDRKTWSKLVSNKDQRPSKRTVCQIVIALELEKHECKHLVKAAGYILNRDPFDIVIRYCVDHKIYDPMKVDELLLKEGLKPLFSEE